MLSQGLTLTLAGMASVFSFLILLVIIMYLGSKTILLIGKDVDTEIKKPNRKSSDLEIAVAIAAAHIKNKEKM